MWAVGEVCRPTQGDHRLIGQRRLDAEDEVTVDLVNPTHRATGGIGVSLTYVRRQLPRLCQWRMLGEGLYVTGLEPANCGPLGRVAEAASGDPVPLEPGASRSFRLPIRAAVGPDAAAMAEGARP